MRRRDWLLTLPAAAVLHAAAKAPFEFLSIDGKPLSTAQFKGKAVALYFFMPGCSHCRDVCQILVRLQAKHGAKLQVLGVAYSEDARQRMPDFMMSVSPNYPVGYSTRDEAVQWLGGPDDDGRQVPRLVLFDARGAIRGSHGWRDPIFRDHAREEQAITAAVDSLIGRK